MMTGGMEEEIVIKIKVKGSTDNTEMVEVGALVKGTVNMVENF